MLEPDRHNSHSAAVTIAFPRDHGNGSSYATGTSSTSSSSSCFRFGAGDGLAEVECGWQVFPVCAYLPVCNLGLPFLLNADWVLVASREAVKEGSGFNTMLRDWAAELMAQVGKTSK